MLTSPHGTLRQLAAALPEEVRDDVIIIGSLAAAARFVSPDDEEPVRTKDIDCLLSPHLRAQASGRKTAEALLKNGWRMREGTEWSQPGDASDPTEQLPVVRLVPPEEDQWFLELLSSPEEGQQEGRQFQRLETDFGHFALCSFHFLALAELDPLPTDSGLKIARPEMMALANLLHHPKLGTETMSGLIAGRRIRRSSKDLGRVLALAFLAEKEDEDAIGSWPEAWGTALNTRFPDDCGPWLATIGSGLEQMLQPKHSEDLEEAHHTCITGLLARHRPSLETFEAVGRRVMGELIQPARRLPR
ncbi:MAG: hypothetical protein HND55_05115 [Pseudomonadota bacterium]|nr:MAG: hypothetical protein HND55_05115 [Pseudomonadota bacterium]